MTTINSTTSLSSPALVMEEGADIVTQVIVHPLVMLHVLDHHTRRQEASGRVIGTLLGRRDGKKVRNDTTKPETHSFTYSNTSLRHILLLI
jgi:hypothetical protein